MEVLDVIKHCNVHGLAHITGSGLLKLQRITKLGFEISDPIEPNDIFKFLQQEGNVDELEMYQTFNMGMGFVIVLPQEDVQKAVEITGGKVVGRITNSGIKVKELMIA